MHTTLDLPENLLKRAMKIATMNTKTTGEHVRTLEELIRKETIRGLTNFKGLVCLDLNPDVVRGCR